MGAMSRLPALLALVLIAAPGGFAQQDDPLFQAFVTYSAESAVVFWTPDPHAESYVVYGISGGLVRLAIVEPDENLVFVDGRFEGYAVARVIAGEEGEYVVATPVPCVQYSPPTQVHLDKCPFVG